MEANISTFVDDDLDEYCLLEIFSYLSINDMMQVKNVCRKWRQISQQWLKKVQAVKFKTSPYGTWKWKLYGNYFKRELGSGTDIKKLIPILKLFGHHIKYYYLNYSKSTDIGNKECENMSFNLFPTLCKNVVDANIYSESYPTGNISVIAKHWGQLEKFNFGYYSKSFEKNMYELLDNNQQLKIFSLTYDPNGPKSDRFFTHLPTRIEEIDIKMKANKKKELTYFVSTIKNFTSLNSLRLSWVFFLSDAAGAAIGNLKSLKHLALRYIMNYESHNTSNPIANLENLKSLELIANEDLDGNNLINILNSCKQLEQLAIRLKVLTDKGMMAISKLEKLKILIINATFVSSNSIINSCANLEVFICHNSKMNDNDAIKLVEKATNFWYVKLTDCPNLTEDVVKAANEIANERKKNILHMIVCDASIRFEEVDTPYFKCYDNSRSLSLKLLPNYIRVYLKEHHPYG